MRLLATLGETIKNARKSKGFTQKKLAEKVDVDLTYISKIENDKANYPPKESVIKAIARELELNRDELIFLAGRIPTKDLKLLQQYHETMPIIFQTLRKNPQAFEQFFAKN